MEGWFWLILGVVLAIMAAVWFSESRPESVRGASGRPAQPELKQQSGAESEPSAPTVVAEPVEMGRSVFISYRRGDSADVTGRMYDRFVQKFGRTEVFKDVDSIPLGMDFRKHLQAEVGRCSVCLAVIGRSWLDAKSESGARRLDDPRDHLRIEVEAALARDIPVIPVLVQGAAMPEESDLPESIRGLAFRNAIAVRPDPDFHADVDRLIRGIEAHLQSRDRRSGG